MDEQQAGTTIVPTDSKDLARFGALFAGHPHVYGTYEITGQRDSGKLTGTAVTHRIDVNGLSQWDQLWAGHLSGTRSLGVVPIQPGDTCVFGAVDIDVYEGLEHASIAAHLVELQAPALACRSKSGGCHVFCWSKDPVHAHLMRARLAELARALGHADAEVFPKQDTCTQSAGTGSICRGSEVTKRPGTL
jgi:hypothetical protein